MTFKSKVLLFVLSIFVCLLLIAMLWFSRQPVEIVAVHHRSSGFSDILVKNFPFTDQGKINWWLENRDKLKDQYNIPKPEADGSYYLTFWLFGEGYKEEGKYDRLCFNDMPPPVNCIEKESLFIVQTGLDGKILFSVDNGTYIMQKSGKILKRKSD